MSLDYFALVLLITVVALVFYGVIAVHDIPYDIAKARNHPHRDAIQAACWVSLFFLGVLWPFLWIWAMIYRPERGWGFSSPQADALAGLERRVTELESGRSKS